MAGTDAGAASWQCHRRWRCRRGGLGSLAAQARGSGWAGALRHAAALGAATVASPVAGEFSAAVYQRALAGIVVTSAEGER